MSDGYFDPKKPYFVRWGNLPHWRQEGALYFVTFRLRDSIPEKKIRLWNEERRQLQLQVSRHNELALQRYKAQLVRRIQKWLDRGWGSCILSGEPAASVVESSLRYFDGTRYGLLEWVVAANHVHVLVRPARGVDLSSIVASWKRYTAARLWELPEVRNAMQRSSGSLWQPEPFDHIVRNRQQFDRIVAYIRNHESWRRYEGAL